MRYNYESSRAMVAFKTYHFTDWQHRWNDNGRHPSFQKWMKSNPKIGDVTFD
jgi:hypothetical protein